MRSASNSRANRSYRGGGGRDDYGGSRARGSRNDYDDDYDDYYERNPRRDSREYDYEDSYDYRDEGRPSRRQSRSEYSFTPGSSKRERRATPINGRGSQSGTNRAKSGDGDDNTKVRVVVRVRPVLPFEKKSGTPQLIVFPRSNCTLEVETASADGGTNQEPFEFDHVFPDSTTQATVFEESGVKSLVDHCFNGYDCTIFAYGQTGSGKTYTMSGLAEQQDTNRYDEEMHEAKESDGLVLRGAHHVFQSIRARTSKVNYTVQVSALEIYNETLTDLLNPPPAPAPSVKGQEPPKSLIIRESPERGFFVQNITNTTCDNVEALLGVTAESHRNRRVGSHQLNSDSSRSHSILTLEIASNINIGGQNVKKSGRISFVDLAGSENLKQSGSEGKAAKETASINRSLFALGSVIKALGDISTGKKPKNFHVPYRDSVITRLLRSSLGGSGMTIMVACIAPLAKSRELTAQTLQYATRTRNIKNKPTVSINSKDKLILALQADLRNASEYSKQLQMTLQRAGMPLPQKVAGTDTTNWDELSSVSSGGGDPALQEENDALKRRIKTLEQVFVTGTEHTEHDLWSTNGSRALDAGSTENAATTGAEANEVAQLRRTNARLQRKLQSGEVMEKELRDRLSSLEGQLLTASARSPAAFDVDLVVNDSMRNDSMLRPRGSSAGRAPRREERMMRDSRASSEKSFGRRGMDDDWLDNPRRSPAPRHESRRGGGRTPSQDGSRTPSQGGYGRTPPYQGSAISKGPAWDALRDQSPPPRSARRNPRRGSGRSGSAVRAASSGSGVRAPRPKPIAKKKPVANSYLERHLMN